MDNLEGQPIKQSPTVELVEAIEQLTGSTWNQELRSEVAELVRKYRFEQVASVIARVHKLVRETGDMSLSNKIYMGKY